MSDIILRPDLSAAGTKGLNDHYLNNNIDPGAFRPPEYFVYIYSVSQKQFEVNRPPHIPRLILKGCREDKEYVECAKLAHPFEQSDRDVDNGEVRVRFHNASKIAIDILCPEAVDMDSALAPGANTVDLRAQGLFWSRNNPPTAEEIKKAHGRREKYYRERLERATALEYTNPKELAERINEDDHLAADYFGEEYSWHKKRVKKAPPVAAKVDCPYCGESIKPGVAFHKTDDGEFCVLDWKRALESGRVTKKQVPEDKRWEGFTL